MNHPPSGPEPGSSVPSQPRGPALRDDRLVEFEGVVQLFTSNMPENSFVDFSDAGGHPVFACCWVDKTRVVSARVQFPVCGPGVFRLTLPFRDDDPDAVKLQVSMRMQDNGSHNRRTVPLCTTYACMKTMLRGGQDEFRVLDANVSGNYAVVSMRVLNHVEFLSRPLRLQPSALKQVPALNEMIRATAQGMKENSKKNNTVFRDGADQMEDGISW